jgi:hypothetical protein
MYVCGCVCVYVCGCDDDDDGKALLYTTRKYISMTLGDEVPSLEALSSHAVPVWSWQYEAIGTVPKAPRRTHEHIEIPDFITDGSVCTGASEIPEFNAE